MAYDFPVNPAQDQEFTPPGGPTYVFKSIRWLIKEGGSEGGDGSSNVTWAEIEDKPATFPPTTPIAQGDVTNLTTDLAAKAPLASPTFTGSPKAPTAAVATNSTQIATTAYVKSQGYAPLAGPTFTGVPTAPTAAPGLNNAQLATTAFVAAAVAADVESWGDIVGVPATFPPAPHTHPQADVTNLVADLAAKASVADLALKAPLASPALTGVPTAPTAAPGVSTTQIATTAFVAAAIAAFSGGAVLEVSDTPPDDPVPNTLWWNSATGELFLYYDDGSSVQWVQAAGSSGGGGGGTEDVVEEAPADGKIYARRSETWEALTAPRTTGRNRIVNGGFQISQERGVTEGTSVGFYAADQWAASANAAIGFTLGRQDVAGGFQLATWCSTVKASLATDDYYQVIQNLEGLTSGDTMWPNPGGLPMVARFDVYSTSAGSTYTFKLSDAASTATFMKNFSIPVQNTWYTIEIPIPATVIGSWVDTNAKNMVVGFGFAAGGTYVGIEGWQAGNFVQAAGAHNLLGAQFRTVYIRNVGLYLDPQGTERAPPWETPDISEEMRRCQRYYGMYYNGNTGHQYGVATMIGTLNMVTFPTRMRATPAVTISGTPTLANCTLYDAPVTETGVVQRGTFTATGAARAYGYNLVCNARL